MSVTKRDYYEILGVGREADDSMLKTAYRKLAMKFHPDRNPNDKDAEDKFKEAAEAYGILSDGNKRAAYDRFGHQGVQGAGGGPAGFDPNQFQDFGDILGDFFGFGDLFGGGGARGARGGRPRQQRGDDVRYDLEISFEDAIKGMSAEILVPRTDPCDLCKGSGADANDGLTTCPICRGRGEVVFQQSFLSIRRPCTQCNGRGQIIRRACQRCKGEGHVRSERKLKITVPPGVDNGTRLRLSHEGQPGMNGGPPGDLYVVLRVQEHPVYDRHENELHCRVPVNVAQAALGTQVDLLTFDGLRTVKIPEGTQSGDEIRLKDLGVPYVNGHGRGDLIVHMEVRIPSKLTREQRKLFETLRDTLPAENEPQEKGLFDKVKDYFM